MSHVIVIGAGQAAASFAAKFRALDTQTPLTIIGEEPVVPYQRPPLSKKKYATGEMKQSQLYLRPETWYTEQNITLRTGVGVVRVDRKERTLHLSTGEVLSWTKLMFATGSHF